MSRALTPAAVPPSPECFDQNSKGRTGTLLLTIWMLMLLTVWGFAFVPATGASPEWVAKTQTVCFGTMANGLPALHGWMLLILSPLALLSFLWASHADEIYAAPSYIRSSKPMKWLLLFILFMTMGVAHWTGKRLTFAYRLSTIANGVNLKNPLPFDYPRLNLAAPHFQLINQQQSLVSQDIFHGKVTLLTFAFAHCSTICPILIKTSLEAQKMLQSEKVQIVVISIDPWRDTPSSLPSLAQSWSIPHGSHFLSGDPLVVNQVLSEFKISTARNMKTGQINHAGQIMIVNPEGRIAYSFLNPTVDWLVTASGRVLQDR